MIITEIQKKEIGRLIPGHGGGFSGFWCRCVWAGYYCRGGFVWRWSMLWFHC